jgi:hypothetical protein
MVMKGGGKTWAPIACALGASGLGAGCAAAPGAATTTTCASAQSQGNASVQSQGNLPDTPLVGPAGVAGEPDETLGARALAARSPFTVLIFFSPDCHCLAVHEPRLRALYDADHPRGVQFVMVDSEVRGSPERDAEEARRRAYPYPILVDPGGRLANALHAEYATYAVVVDSAARIHYRGGIDSDRTHLHDGRSRYLEQALDDLLCHREPRLADGEALGCALQTW